VGAVLAVLLVIVLMLNINNGEKNSIGQITTKKQVQSGLLANIIAVPDLG